MRRGTTPTLTFTLSIPVDTITLLNIAFAQRRKVVIERNLQNVDLDRSNNIIKVTLTEEETLKLSSDNSPMEVQLRVGVGDSRMASDIFEVNVDRILKGGVLE